MTASRTVLIVDDSAEDRELYRRCLSCDPDYTYTLLEASLGQQGLTLWQQHQPDVVLLDYRLPDLDGLEFLAQLQSPVAHPCLPVIVVTGQGNEAIAVQAMKAGAQDYLVKEQITPQGLSLAVNGAIETVQLRTQLQQRIERERLVAQITQKIHQSLNLDDILETTVTEVRQFLQTDRVFVCRSRGDGWGTVITESVGQDWASLLHTPYPDPIFQSPSLPGEPEALPHGPVIPSEGEPLHPWPVRANLVVPILQHGQVWGALMAHHCVAPRQWQPLEVDLLKELATQVGIALQQAELYQQAQEELKERRRVEQELRDSQERFQQLTENIDAVFWCKETPDDRVSYVSPAYGRLWGLNPQELYDNAQAWGHHIHPEDREWSRQAFQEKAATGQFDEEYRIVLADGRVRWVRDRCFPLRDASGQIYRFTGIAEDITERKQAEQALGENEKLLRLALEGAQAGSWDWEIPTGKIFWSPENMALYGLDLPLGCPQYQDWYEALHPEDRQRTQAEVMHVMDQHLPEFRTEFRILHPQQGVRWLLGLGRLTLDDQGNPVRMSGINLDITERKQMELALQERNDHIQLLYQTARGLLSTDQPLSLIETVFQDLKGLIGLDVYFNYVVDQPRQTLHLTFYGGITDELARDIERLDMGEAICGTVAQQGRQIMQANLQQSTDAKTQLVRSLGLMAYCCQPLMAQGRVFGTLGFGSRSRSHFTAAEQHLFQAICDQFAIALERAELLSSLQHQAEELMRANHIKDEFLAILSHELRSPLNPILGWTKLMQSQRFDPAKTMEALATIERNVRLQTQLIDDLLDVAKILRGKLPMETAPVDLAFVIEAAIDTVRAAAVAKNIHLHPVLPPIGPVFGDAVRLQQIVWNLLSNAIKFTPVHGHVEVELSVVEDAGSASEQPIRRPPPRHPLPHYAQITVQDTGRGIKPDFLPHIFESFRQEDASTTRQHGGLGLGLAIVRHLVEAHGGTIWADSPGEGQGATFTVRLPLQALDSDAVPSGGTTKPDLTLSGLRVLAVDDEPDARELLTVLLSQYEAEVLTVASAAEALTHLPTFQPHVLVSDVGMPSTDGYALIQQVRALPPDQGGQVAAIALTAYARDEDAKKAIASGYQRHITKPIDPEQVVRAVIALAHQPVNGVPGR